MKETFGQISVNKLVLKSCHSTRSILILGFIFTLGQIWPLCYWFLNASASLIHPLCTVVVGHGHQKVLGVLLTFTVQNPARHNRTFRFLWWSKLWDIRNSRFLTRQQQWSPWPFKQNWFKNGGKKGAFCRLKIFLSIKVHKYDILALK